MKFLKENGYPCDLIFSSESIISTDKNSWKEIKINISANGKEMKPIYCTSQDYSNCIKSYQKGFFDGFKFYLDGNK